jgi:hypothetical protein
MREREGALFTLMLPTRSPLTGLRATLAMTSKIVVRDSAASRNSVVEMALSRSASTGTSTNDCLNVSTMVPSTGIEISAVAMAVGVGWVGEACGRERERERESCAGCDAR